MKILNVFLLFTSISELGISSEVEIKLLEIYV